MKTPIQMEKIYNECDPDEMVDTLLLGELKLKIFIGTSDTFAYVNMFENEDLKEAAMQLWQDGCMYFSDYRGLYEVEFEIESGFDGCEDYEFALVMNKFNKIED